METEAFAVDLPRQRPKDVCTTSISEVNFAGISPRSSALESEKDRQRGWDQQQILGKNFKVHLQHAGNLTAEIRSRIGGK